MMLAKFRDRYPQGSLVSKLVKIDRGTFIVRVSISVDNTTLVSSLAGANTVEAAEDAARARAISTLFLDQVTTSDAPVVALATPPQVSIRQPAPAPAPQPALPAPASQPVVAENADNVVNFSKPSSDAEPELAASTVAEIEPEIAPIPIPKASETVSEPIPEPKSTVETGNLFAGTFQGDNLDEPSDEPSLVPEIASVENTATAATSKPISEPLEMADFDFNQVKQKTDIEIERLGWTRDDGREFLQSRYGKRSRLHLKNEELLEFLHYLEKQPTPVS